MCLSVLGSGHKKLNLKMECTDSSARKWIKRLQLALLELLSVDINMFYLYSFMIHHLFFFFFGSSDFLGSIFATGGSSTFSSLISSNSGLFFFFFPPFFISYSFMLEVVLVMLELTTFFFLGSCPGDLSSSLEIAEVVFFNFSSFFGSGFFFGLNSGYACTYSSSLAFNCWIFFFLTWSSYSKALFFSSCFLLSLFSSLR